jgi:hypothetical protein
MLRSLSGLDNVRVQRELCKIICNECKKKALENSLLECLLFYVAQFCSLICLVVLYYKEN